MQAERAARLRASWGDRPCNHPSFDKEYMLSAQTGDYICEQCGREFTRDEMLRAETTQSPEATPDN